MLSPRWHGRWRRWLRIILSDVHRGSALSRRGWRRRAVMTRTVLRNGRQGASGGPGRLRDAADRRCFLQLLLLLLLLLFSYFFNTTC